MLLLFIVTIYRLRNEEQRKVKQFAELLHKGKYIIKNLWIFLKGCVIFGWLFFIHSEDIYLIQLCARYYIRSKKQRYRHDEYLHNAKHLDKQPSPKSTHVLNKYFTNSTIYPKCLSSARNYLVNTCQIAGILTKIYIS